MKNKESNNQRLQIALTPRAIQILEAITRIELDRDSRATRSTLGREFILLGMLAYVRAKKTGSRYPREDAEFPNVTRILDFLGEYLEKNFPEYLVMDKEEMDVMEEVIANHRQHPNDDVIIMREDLDVSRLYAEMV